MTPTAIAIGSAELASPLARGAAAYLGQVNARGGVHGRSVVLRLEDENVFAVLGSPSASADMPQLFVDTGSTAVARGPWAIGFRPSWRAEGRILGS